MNLKPRAIHLSLFLVLSGPMSFVLAQQGGQPPRLTPPSTAPVRAVSIRSVFNFTPGDFVESVALDREGNVYASVTGKERARVWRLGKDGQTRDFFVLPEGYQAGNLVFDTQGTLYLTAGPSGLSPRTATQARPSLWRITPEGAGTMLAGFPAGANPNGITINDEGELFVADSNLGRMWRIDPVAARAEVWLDHPLLKPSGTGLPGANGLKFFGSALYVSNSDTGNIIRIPVNASGKAGMPNIFVSRLPTDDFAFDERGNLYVTTHLFNSVVRVTPRGVKTVLATEAQGVVGPSNAAFGVGPGASELYVVTDGGLFATFLGRQDPSKLSPKLLKLDIGVKGLTLPALR